jgi:PAS domain S-box-containing protein
MDPILLLAALQGADAGIIITDREGTIQWINTEFSRMTGYSSEDAVGRNPRLLKAGTHPQSYFADLWRTILSGSAWHGEMLNRRKDGSLYTEEQNITPVFNERHEVTHFIGIKHDITARKRMEEELRESNERYQSLIECLGEGIVSVAQGRVRMANPAAEIIFGVPRGELIGKELSDFVHPADIPLLASEESRARGEKNIFELRVIRPDGERRTLQMTATPLYDTRGQFQSSLGVIRDITDEKRVLQTLKLLARTLNSIDECVSICDPDDRLLFVNRAFLRAYGYEECNLLGENISLVRSPLNSLEVASGILPATLAGGWSGELWTRKRDGTDFLVMLNTAAVIDGNGRVEATVGVARDITEPKRAEAELTRTRDLAESANRAKSDFLAMMSHEIRTPMNGVIGMTGLLLDTQLTPEQRDYAETVRKSGDALLTVINDILDFSKIEAGKLLIEYFSFDLRLVLEEVNEMLAAKAEEHDLELILEYPAGLPRHFIGDAGRIRQVVTNLVGNAIKFTPKGSVRVIVECVREDTQTARMRVAVQDTGIGIAQEKLASIFARFSQVDTSITRRYGGTGLGLAIAKQLIELMGGSVAVESRLGEGSTFSFNVPFFQDSEPRVGADVAGLRGLRVLVVDDHEVNRRVLIDLTANWGIRSGSSSSGEEALQALRAAQASGDRYDFVVLDYQMPGMDGPALAAAIKADSTLREAVVVMLSSVGQWAEVRHMEGASIDACLVKPVRQEQLLNTLATAWGKKVNSVDGEHRIAELKARWEVSFSGLGLRVLVAEDNAVNQKVAVRMLEKLGLRADLASNGREAVELREMLPYDLILMDCQMPEMDGYEAAREIRRREGGQRQTAIVAMTAEAMSGAREKCIEAGMDDYIAKPVRLEDMVEALQKWLPDGK